MPGTLSVSCISLWVCVGMLILPLVLQKEDVLKVDFGVHVKGRILDSAFTLNFEPTYNRLLEAVKDATNTGVRVRSIPCLFFLLLLALIYPVRRLALMYV